MIAFAWGCLSEPPGSVGEERGGIDVEACARKVAPCSVSGDVNPIEALVPGEFHAVKLGKGGTVSAILQRPSNDSKLAFLAIGLRTAAEQGAARVSVKLDGAIDAILVPVAGPTRTEIDAHNVVPGQVLTISCLEGEVDLIYVIGRWN
jgi:hypothetical protein